MSHTSKLITMLLALGVTLLIVGCQESPAPVEPDRVSNLPIETIPEAEQYRDRLASGRAVTWTVAPGADASCVADAEAIQIVGQEVSGMGGELARVDFAAVSIPRFVTVTQKLKLDAASWAGAEVEIDACGTEGGSDKWRIYSVKGPEIEQLPNLTQVHRWAQVYALYDADERAVKKLLATVRGYVLE